MALWIASNYLATGNPEDLNLQGAVYYISGTLIWAGLLH